MSKRVLVTGAGGFVGAHLVRALADRDDEVFGLGIEPVPEALTPRLSAQWQADLRDLDAVLPAVLAARPDTVVHLAAQSSAGRSFEDPKLTFQVNALGTWTLLEAVRRAAPRARVLVVGTGEVYGPQPEGTRSDEDTPMRPVNPYALAKAVADVTAQVMGESHGLDVVRTRSFGHAGRGQTTRFLLPALAQQLAAIEAGRAEPRLKVGNLDVIRDLCDVRDVVRAYLLLIDRGRSGTAYNVCRGTGVQLSAVVNELIALAGARVSIETDSARLRPTDVPYLVGDPTRIEREVGWRPTIPLSETLREVLDEWRSNR